MKVLIVEEALRTLHGHWFQYISDIIHGGRAAGHEIEVAVHKDACPEILRALPCRPILTDSVFEGEKSNPSIGGSTGRILRHNRILFRDLAPIVLGGEAQSYDVVIATTPRLDHMLAYQCLAMNLPRKSRLRFVLLMIESVGKYSNQEETRPRFSPRTLPLRLAMKWNSFLPSGDRILFATESEGLARQYESFCLRRMPLVPHVTELPDLSPYRVRNSVSESPGKLSFGTYGFTRYDKGLDVLQSSLRFLLSEKGELPDSNFFIQWTSDYRLPDGTLIEQDPILNRLDNITYIPEFNSSEDYYNWIARTDIMLLPYRRGFYRDKLSRVAIDAALAGIPIIYPKGTWLEGFVANHAAGVSFEEANPKSLAVAIEHSVRTHNELKGLAISRQEKTASFFSAKSFFKEIAVMTSSSHY